MCGDKRPFAITSRSGPEEEDDPEEGDVSEPDDEKEPLIE